MPAGSCSASVLFFPSVLSLRASSCSGRFACMKKEACMKREELAVSLFPQVASGQSTDAGGRAVSRPAPTPPAASVPGGPFSVDGQAEAQPRSS